MMKADSSAPIFFALALISASKLSEIFSRSHSVHPAALRSDGVHPAAMRSDGVHLAALRADGVHPAALRSDGVHPAAMRSDGVHPAAMRSDGVHLAALRSDGVHPAALRSDGVHPAAMRSDGVHPAAMRADGVHLAAMRADGVHPAALRSDGVHPAAMRADGVHPAAMRSDGVHPAAMRADGVHPAAMRSDGVHPAALRADGVHPAALRADGVHPAAMRSDGVHPAAMRAFANSTRRNNGMDFNPCFFSSSVHDLNSSNVLMFDPFVPEGATAADRTPTAAAGESVVSDSGLAFITHLPGVIGAWPIRQIILFDQPKFDGLPQCLRGNVIRVRDSVHATHLLADVIAGLNRLSPGRSRECVCTVVLMRSRCTRFLRGHSVRGKDATVKLTFLVAFLLVDMLNLGLFLGPFDDLDFNRAALKYRDAAF